MRRNFFRGLMICLIPTAIAGLFTVMAFNKELSGGVGFRRGIDLAGGTILVYEIDVDGMKRKIDDENRQNENKPNYVKRVYENEQPDMRELAEKIKKRIDPSDLKNVVVRPVGDSRIEIILPYAGSTGGGKEAANEEFAEEVRQQVKQAGVLEFRILANTTDDDRGIQDAQQALETPTDADRAENAKRALEGLPPLGPTKGPYLVKTSERGEEIEVAYQWLELSPEERDSLGLSNRYADPATAPRKRGMTPEQAVARHREVAAQRGKAIIQGGNSGASEGNKSYSYLLYSRPVTKPVEKWSRDEFQPGEFAKYQEWRATAEDKRDNEWKPKGKEVEYFLLTRVSPKDTMKVTGDVRLEARSDQDPTKGPAVGFTFRGEGPRRFGEMTERNQPTSILRSLAIVMDNKIVSAPTLNAILREGGQISGNFTQKSVNRLVSILKSGNLNADLKPEPVSTNSVGATLGESTIRSGLLAVAGSFGAVLLFMVFYYRFAGFVACVALFINLLLTVGFMVAVNAAFTLPGLAGLVLMLGMAVDANVLIYERIREEREKGATLVGAIRNGYDRAFGTIIDTHLTSIFTSIVLYTFGNDNLKGFSVALTLGLVISLFTSLYVTRLMFDFWTHKKWLSQLKMMKLFARPKFDFMRIRVYMFTLTAVLTVGGLALFLARGEKTLNVDFTQGTAYGGRLVEGQERGLGTTSDGKLGLLDLIGRKRQDERLKVKEVVWESRPADGAAETRAGDNYYRIVYEEPDGKTTDVTVTLANKPEGATEAEQLADLKARAGHLPDTSVEQVFLKDDDFEQNKSRSFTIRTTEKEPELVQVMLDRLLRDETTNAPLLTATRLAAEPVFGLPAEGARPANAAAVTVTFTEPVSPGYFKRFLLRAVRLELQKSGVDSSTAEIATTGVFSADPAQAADESRSQRYRTIRADLSGIDEYAKLNATAADVADRERLAAQQAQLKAELASAVAAARKAFEERPAPDRLEVFDPALAASTRNSALLAVLVSWIAILVFLWFRFGSWTFGLAAVLCLIHDLCFTLGAIAACHYLHDTTVGGWLLLQDFKIDLAAVAALLTLVGYSVNDTIVVFDRIREVRGKSPVLTTQMINDSVNQTLSRTILAALTVFLVVVVLYIWGGEGVHLFAFVMVMGVIVGTYSSIYIAAPLLLFFGEGKAKTTDAAAPPPSAGETQPTAMAT